MSDLVVRCRAEIDRLRAVKDAMGDGRLVAYNGWLCETYGGCNCAGGTIESYAHENHCGLEPLVQVGAGASLFAESANLFPAALDAFTAILDLHQSYEANGWDDDVDPETVCADCGRAWPCATVVAVCAALGVQP